MRVIGGYGWEVLGIGEAPAVIIENDERDWVLTVGEAETLYSDLYRAIEVAKGDK